jgi:hypothetical protein
VAEFSLWVNWEAKRQKSYDCDLCLKKDFNGKNCFLFGDEVQTVEVRTKTSKETRELTSDDIFDEVLPELMEGLPSEVSYMDAMFSLMPKVCCKSLTTNEISELQMMEFFCKDYHVPPLGADIGYLDYPTKMIDIFSIISSARERVKANEMKAHQFNSGGGTKSG